MKRLRKLLGILLTGVMALTLLVGCAGTAALNEKEILATLKDYHKLEYPGVEVSEDTTNYAKKAAGAIKTYYSDPANDQDISVEELVRLSRYNSDRDPAQIAAAVVPEGSTDQFYLNCIATEQPASPYLQEHQNAMIAQSLSRTYRRSSPLNYPGSVGDKHFLSLCTETFNGKTYVFLITRCPAA